MFDYGKSANEEISARIEVLRKRSALDEEEAAQLEAQAASLRVSAKERWDLANDYAMRLTPTTPTVRPVHDD